MLRRNRLKSTSSFILAVVTPHATRPPSMCSACSPVIKQKNATAGWVMSKRGIELSCHQATICPPRKAEANTPAAVSPHWTCSISRRRSRGELSGAAYRNLCPLQRRAAQNQHRSVQPQKPQRRSRTPVLMHHTFCIGDDQEHEQNRDHRKKDSRASSALGRENATPS